MKLVVFGLSISSSWGNGHATLWRGLCRALAEKGHRVVFFERDVPYYAQARDFVDLGRGRVHLYADWNSVASIARRELDDADVGMVTSYCPDATPATDMVCGSNLPSVFYDLDSPVTLSLIRSVQTVDYLPAAGLSHFDLVLSYAAGPTLELLKSELGARRVAPLCGWVDPQQHCPQPARSEFHGDLSYLGTYTEDRQAALLELLLEPAQALPNKRFVLAGAKYPDSFPWGSNVFFVRHLPPGDHGSFFCSSPLTLNVTRKAMAELGYCPSGRLFEAAACGIPVLTDYWEGLEEFYTPGAEILVARSRAETIEALEMDPMSLARIGRAAYERTMECHTASVRVGQFEQAIESIKYAAPAAS